MITAKFKKKFLSSIKGKVYFNKSLKRYTYFKIGGPAMMWIEPRDIEDLKTVLDLCRRFKVPSFIFGSGANLLVDDKGVKKAFINLSSPRFKWMRFIGNRVRCGCGISVASLIKSSVKRGIGGLEFLAGIPGTVGGAVAMNAGSPAKSIGEFVERIKVMDRNGRLKEFQKNDLRFHYRGSNLKDKVILEAQFRLRKGSLKVLRQRLDNFTLEKRKTQDIGYPNAGCIFKNPSSKTSSGRLLELAGMKGVRIGDAQFSTVHANFIINLGHAKSSEVLSLIKIAKRAIKKRWNLCLEPEIQIVK